ncbi:MAG: GGDEF domain-containing response regulator, partial [Candidatus Zipacnadales bacterium]
MNVLVAEDDRADCRLLEATLHRWGYGVIVAQDGKTALEILSSENPPRIAIVDWVMPGLDGPDVCRKLRALGREPYVYIILLTSKDSKEDIVRGIEAGADDYITKPWDREELRSRLRAGCRIVELQNKLIEARDALQHQATHDPLTGLWNRGAALAMLERELERADREDKPLCVSIADLDGFKRINDTYGHAVGDAVLIEVARRLVAGARPYDTIGRYGGEEFLIIAPGCNDGTGPAMIERLRELIAASPIPTDEGPIRVTGSFGVAIREAKSDAAMRWLLKRADAAMYEAKAKGGTVTVYLRGDAE